MDCVEHISTVCIIRPPVKCDRYVRKCTEYIHITRLFSDSVCIKYCLPCLQVLVIASVYFT